jgi:DNA (cytosine-5)-methyltransferase 1
VAADFGPYAEAIARWEPIVGRPAPEPVDSKGRLNPVFVEWMMGLPDGWVSSRLEARTRALKVLGNGVVPQQAAAAVRILIDQLGNKTNEEEK